MMPAAVSVGENLHASAIVVGQTGVLLMGPSGSGKSSTAFACLNAAVGRGWHAALVADDRTILTVSSGRCIASCPAPIQGLLELRGTGILTVPRVERAVIHLAVILTEPSARTRLPADAETFSCNSVTMPLMRLWRDGTADPLSRLGACHPELFFS